jgi:transcriptional regulator with XRE-family HTH domain
MKIPETAGAVLDEDRLLCLRTGGLLAEIRRSAGLSQAALGRIAGIHTNSISKIERGLCDPNILVVGRLFLSLGCDSLSISEKGISTSPIQGYRPTAPDSLEFYFKPDDVLVMNEEKLAQIHGLTIRDRRMALGLSLKDAASRAGIHTNTLWNFENGNSALSLSNAIRLYLYLNIRQVLVQAPSMADAAKF